MKKIIGMSMLASMLMLGACSEDNAEEELEADQSADEPVSEEADETQGVSVKKNLLSVDVTIPAALLEEADLAETKADMEEDGAKDIQENEDGSLSFKMSKSDHKEMMQDMQSGIEEMIEDLSGGEDFPSIESVNAKPPYSSFNVTVDREAYENSLDGFANLTLAISGMYYQVLNGAEGETTTVTIHLKDADTGEEYDSIVYPDALEESE